MWVMTHPAKFIAIALLALSAATAQGTPHVFGDGTHLVGTDIQPGVYQAPGGESCTWLLHRGGHQYVTSLGTDRDVVEILGSDLAFHTERCGTWGLAAVAPGDNDERLPNPSAMVLGTLVFWVQELVTDRAVLANIHKRTREGVYASLHSPKYAAIASELRPGIDRDLAFLEKHLGPGTRQ